MTNPQRVKAKFYVADPTTVDLPAFIPLFHRWIQEHAVEGMLLDVADYKHVIDGPGVLLMGFDADYAIDLGRGRPGLQYDHKREWPQPAAEDPRQETQTRIRLALHRALRACQLLENAPELNGRFDFKYDEVEITFVDRLHTPNQPEIVALLSEDVKAVVGDLYDGDIEVTALNEDARRPVALHIKAASQPDLAAFADTASAAG